MLETTLRTEPDADLLGWDRISSGLIQTLNLCCTITCVDGCAAYHFLFEGLQWTSKSLFRVKFWCMVNIFVWTNFLSNYLYSFAVQRNIRSCFVASKRISAYFRDRHKNQKYFTLGKLILPGRWDISREIFEHCTARMWKVECSFPNRPYTSWWQELLSQTFVAHVECHCIR